VEEESEYGVEMEGSEDEKQEVGGRSIRKLSTESRSHEELNLLLWKLFDISNLEEIEGGLETSHGCLAITSHRDERPVHFAPL